MCTCTKLFPRVLPSPLPRACAHTRSCHPPRPQVVNTVYLQCGSREDNADKGIKNRFYRTLDEWHKANPAPVVEKPLGPVIHT